MRLLQILKEKFRKPKETIQVEMEGRSFKVERVDAHLPSDMRLDGYVLLPGNVFEIYSALGSLIQIPEHFSNKIVAISSFSISDKVQVYRAYLTKPDFLDLTTSFIQVTVKNKEVLDCIYFESINAIYPQDLEEWGYYRKGMDEQYVHDSSGNKFEGVGGKFPVLEVGVLDPAGREGWTANLLYKFYMRNLSEDTMEYFIFEEVDYTLKNTVSGIRFLVGIPLPLDTTFIKGVNS